VDGITDDLDYSGDQFPLDCLVDLGGLPLDLVEEDQIVLRAAIPVAVSTGPSSSGSTSRIAAVNLLVPQ